jgi:hypothetical protein
MQIASDRIAVRAVAFFIAVHERPVMPGTIIRFENNPAVQFVPPCSPRYGGSVLATGGKGAVAQPVLVPSAMTDVSRARRIDSMRWRRASTRTCPGRRSRFSFPHQQFERGQKCLSAIWHLKHGLIGNAGAGCGGCLGKRGAAK